MKRLAATIVLAAAFFAASGCGHYGPRGAVPPWMGIPASILSPTSLEAMSWKERNKPLQGEQYMYPFDPCPDF